MKKLIFSLVVAVLALMPSGSILADTENHSPDQWSKAKEIIESGVSCDELSKDQLELLGDYYMEQMHPGEQHELMDKMMGGEGSESLRQAHIFMARRWYCGDAVGMGMMGMMMGGNVGMGGGVMGSGMMGGGMMGSGMVDSGVAGMMTGSGTTQILIWIFLITGIVALGKYLFKK